MLRTDEVASSQPTTSTREHAVKFYVEDDDLNSTLADYVRQAIDNGQGVLVLATRERFDALESALAAGDYRLEDLVERDQLLFVDADEARDMLMVKGKPSPARFESVIEAPISQLAQAWPEVGVYDEVADLLAGDSQFGPVRQLEQMWEKCWSDGGFGLLTGYRLDHFGEPGDEQPFDNICRARRQVLAAGETGGRDVATWQRRTIMLNQRLESEQAAHQEARDALELERERIRRRDEFVGNFAHELRNPLAPMLSAVEVMNLRGDTSTERERSIIERQVSRIVNRVNDFSKSSRIMFDRAEFEPERIETHDVVSRAVELAEPVIEDGEHRLHVDVVRSGLMLEADPARLAEAIAELLINAAAYTPTGGNIWLHAKREMGSVAISVRDDGPGIAPSLLDDIFEMFTRGELEAHAEQGGMGLGLAMVRKVAEVHDGAVAAFTEQRTRSDEGPGSEFVMRLPLAEPATQNPRVSRLGKGEVASGGQVLIVDDNEDFANMLAETLDLLGHDVRRALDADEALEMLTDFWPDVALLDINLPGMNGHELAERISKQAKVRGEFRMVAITGYSDERKRRKSEEMGFDAHLVKPIVLSQLQKTLDSVLVD